ncbi:MAG: glycosyltransferase [Phycisphaeraceae bacterium]|nr:glycosyltransferase [Phycisphaeraceae bacterium]
MTERRTDRLRQASDNRAPQYPPAELGAETAAICDRPLNMESPLADACGSLRQTLPGAGVLPGVTRLVVFSDDWGRHPSSCQHLIRHLLPRYPTIWVNTIGTRRVRLAREDAGKIIARLGSMLGLIRSGAQLPAGLQVVNPWMYPGFRRGWQRRLNAAAICTKVNALLGPRLPGERRIAITTVPVTADLRGRLAVDRWVYYCVDDFSVWPGLDGSVLDDMERKLAGQVDAAVAVSPTLQTRLAGMGCASTLLTHGLDLAHWQPRSAKEVGEWITTASGRAVRLERPVALFWGVVDRRLDVAWCKVLAERCGTLLLVGPKQSPDPALEECPGVEMTGPLSYAQLPALAEAADVLVMPYADLPVTRAIQPLKFKEYLATGKPVIVRQLPATIDWADAADVVGDEARLRQILDARLSGGVPAEQLRARGRLANESWTAKAKEFERVVVGE